MQIPGQIWLQFNTEKMKSELLVANIQLGGLGCADPFTALDEITTTLYDLVLIAFHLKSSNFEYQDSPAIFFMAKESS
jgi:hypothetical protein